MELSAKKIKQMQQSMGEAGEIKNCAADES